MYDPDKPIGRPTTPDRPAPVVPDMGLPITSGEPGTGTRPDTVVERSRSLERSSAPSSPPPPARTAYQEVLNAPAASLPSLAPVPDAFALLKALQHRWLLALSVGLIFATAAAAATWLVLPRSMSLVTATAKLHMRSREMPAPFWVGSDSIDFGTFKQTQFDTIKTRPILEAALQIARGDGVELRSSNAVAWLEKQIKVDLSSSSEIIEISMTGENPREVTVLVNAVVHAYLNHYHKVEKEQREARLGRVDQFQKQNEKDIQVLLEKVNKLKPLVNGKPNDPREVLSLETFTALQKEYFAIVSQLEKMQVQIDFEREKQKSGVVAPIPQNLLEEQLEKDADYKRLVDERVRINNLVAAYKSYANENSPLVKKTLDGYAGDLDILRKRTEERRKELQPRIERQLRDTKPELGMLKLKDLENQFELMTREKDRLAKRYEQQAKEVEKYYKETPQTLDNMLKEIDRKQKVAESLGMEVEARRIEYNNPPRVTLIQDAIQPEPRDSNRQTKTIVLAGLSAFLFVGFCTAWFEFRSRRIHTANDIINEIGLRLLGTVPALSESYRLHPLSLDESRDSPLHNVITESMDGIRTMLLHESRQNPLRVLMVTSGISGEGKTTFSSHLALSLAHAGVRTLLIDCDLVRPTVQQLFGLALQPGLCEVLRGEVETASAIVATPARNLSILPAGKFDRHVSQILAKGGIQRLFDRLKEEYEFIVLDSSPVLSVANTLLIGQHVDGVIMSILRNVSQVPRVHAAYQRLTALGIRVIGSVFNKERSQGYYGYHGYYGYGSSNNIPAPPLPTTKAE